MHELEEASVFEAAQGYRLRFSSTTERPLAFARGKPVSVGKFRADVERSMDSLGGGPNVLISCASRYGFAVALLSALASCKTAILPPNSTGHALQAVRKQCSIAGECDEAWAEDLLEDTSGGQHGDWCMGLDPDHTAVRLFTSGSTGIPKVVHKSTANLIDEARTLLNSQPWPRLPIVGSVPPQHMYGLTFSVFLPWVAGVPWVDETPRFAQDLRDTLAVTGAGTLISVPAHYRTLLEDDIDFTDVRCVSAAAVLPRDTALAWRARYGSEILEVYGCTETGIVAHRGRQGNLLWRPFPGVEVSEVGGLLKVTSPFIGDACVGSGFETADRVVLHADQSFELLGRADSIIKIAGKRVSLTAVEKTLCAFPGVTEAAALAVPTPGRVRDHVIWAVVAGRWQRIPGADEIKAYLRSRMDGIEVPRRICVVDKMPRTAHGKMPRSALLELFGSTEQAGV